MIRLILFNVYVGFKIQNFPLIFQHQSYIFKVIITAKMKS